MGILFSLLLFLFCGSTTEITVRPTEIDVKGHVNNAKYVEYIQWGRWEWLDKNGFTNDKLAQLNTTLVVANLNISYRSESKQGEKLFVSTKVIDIGEKSFVVNQTIKRSNGDMVVYAEVVMVAVDTQTHKSKVLPDTLKKFLTCEAH